MKHLMLILLALICFRVHAADTAQSDWPAWRGPLTNGSSVDADPPLTWSKDHNIRWKTALPGEGASTPIVWQNQVFVLYAVQTDEPQDAAEPISVADNRFNITQPTRIWRFVVASYDRASGKLLWEHTAATAIPHQGRHPDNTFASGSPATDGKRLYVSFGSRGVYAYSLDGVLIWKCDLGQMDTRRSFGEASTPVVHGDSLVLQWDHEGDSYLYRLNASTGDIVWKVARDEDSNWSVPLIAPHTDGVQIVASGHKAAIGYSLNDGSTLWSCGGQTKNCVPSPLRLGDVVYCMSGFRGSGLFAISLDARGDASRTGKVRWSRTRDTPYVPSPLLYGTDLYFLKTNQGILTCVDAHDGKEIIPPSRLASIESIYASPVGAAGRVYLTGRDGTTLVLQKGPPFKVLATNSLADPIDASMALAGDCIFVRSRSMLYCIGQ
jgi:outer membrane protein assembly factor BamB